MATYEVEVDGYVEELVENPVGGVYTVEAGDEDEAKEIAEAEFSEEYGYSAYSDNTYAYEMEDE